MMISMQIDKIKAKGAAFRLSEEYGIEHPREIDLEAIAEDKGVTVIDAPLVGLEARLVRNGDRGVIRVKAGPGDTGRRRFSIAHELGHWFLHEGTSQIFPCTAENLRDYKNSAVEIEANIFAAEFLMPTWMFAGAIKDKEVTIENIQACASEFKTSLTSTAIRFTELSQHRTIIVLSKNGRIKWWRPKLDGSHPWIEFGKPLHPESLAKYCTDADALTTVEHVPTEAWLEDNTFSRQAELTEQSIRLPGYCATYQLMGPRPV
jgi:Zn-dependent peptidase ImmA (M78 family)